ncbi:MAG: hypothetical protein JW816_01010 [Candidatus Buchananbacteria bacterium]|nr:hypothetical protein [Candidatus Buchananbacteria bacterium]
MLKIGHRGAKAYALENTLSSVQKALEMGVDMVELDIRITKDNQPVIIHSSQLKRLTQKFGRVSKLTLAELKKLKVKEIETIPTLGEVLEAVKNQIGLNLELKVKGGAQIVVQTLRDHKADMAKVMVSSNYPSEIKTVEQLEPIITTALIFRATNAFSFWFVSDFLALLFLPITKYYIAWLVKNSNADYLSIYHRLLGRRKVALLKKQGIKICAWTVNNQRKIDYLKSLGVDGIITNYPDRL